MANPYAAYNAEQRAKLRQQLHAAVDMPHDVAAKAIKAIGYDLEGEIKKSLAGPGKGRVYKKRNPTRIHVASAPGDPPASDTGRLMGSISVSKPEGAALKGRYEIAVGSHVKYAPFLEFGTRPRKGNGGIRPRPYFRRAAATMAAKIPYIIGVLARIEAAKLKKGV